MRMKMDLLALDDKAMSHRLSSRLWKLFRWVLKAKLAPKEDHNYRNDTRISSGSKIGKHLRAFEW